MLNKIQADNKGQILAIVLCFLALGSLTIATLLAFVGIGIKTDEIYNERMKLYYAADAGLEEAIWRSQNEELPLELGDYETELVYTLSEEINGKTVGINITQVWPLTGLESDDYGTEISEALTITGGIVNRDEGKYKIQMSYDGSEGALPVDRIAVWLPPRFSYVSGSSKWSDILEENDPTISSQRGGVVLTWDFDPAIDFDELPKPQAEGGFQPGEEYPATRRLYFRITPTGEIPGGSYTWIRTEDTDIYLAWETGCSIFKVTSTATDSASGKGVSLDGYTYFSEGAGLGEGGFQVRGNYIAIGNSLMEDNEIYYDMWGNPDHIRDTLIESNNATIPNLPVDAEIVKACLYWSGWWGVEGADTVVTFQVDSENITEVTASKYSLLPAAGNFSYSAYADVTELVVDIEGGVEHCFTVGNVSGKINEHWSYAGWSLVIFYYSPAEDARQFFLYDQFLFAAGYDHHYFTIEGFEAPEDVEATLTCFVGEGDDWRTGDYLQFNNNFLYGGVNPKYNVWNGLSSGLGGETIEGIDIDTFDASPYIDPHDTTAEVHLYAGGDSWDMVYILLAFRSEYGGLTPNAIGIISYSYGE